MATGDSLKLFGGLFKAFSQIGAGREADEVSEQNALQLNAEADVRLDDARQQAFGVLKQAKRLKGTQRASSAARGVVVGKGSSLDLIAETTINSRLQAADAVRVGQIQSAKLKFQARQQTHAGNVASRAGLIQGIGTLIETGSQVGIKNPFKKKKKLDNLGATDLPNAATGLV